MDGCWVYGCMGVNPRKKRENASTPGNQVWTGVFSIHTWEIRCACVYFQVCISRCVFQAHTPDLQACISSPGTSQKALRSSNGGEGLRAKLELAVLRPPPEGRRNLDLLSDLDPPDATAIHTRKYTWRSTPENAHLAIYLDSRGCR